MAFMTWGPQLEIGIHEIDLQHRNLLAIANHLHDAIAAGQAMQAVDWILEELTLYAKYHFATEEKLMKRHRHADSEEHTREHEKMLKAIRRFKKKFHAGEPRVEHEVMEFLGVWMTRHIMGSDRALGQDLAAKGVS